MLFSDLGLAQPLLRAVESQGYTTPTPIQLQAIPHVLAGKDVLGCAQTGTGKTAAFALPILHRLTQPATTSPDAPKAPAPHGKGRRRPIRVLVLSPTRELAGQIAESFHTYGAHTHLRQAVVYGGVSQVPQTRALQQGVDILVATPGRLCDLMQQGFVDLSTVEIFVLDEADHMFDMGFLPDLNRIIAQLPKRRQTLFFSATMPDAISRLASEILHEPVGVRIAPVKATADLVEQSVYQVSQVRKPQLLTAFLAERPKARVIVFTRTKHGADKVVKQLERDNIRADAIHGNKSQNQRQRILGAFKGNRLQVLVATDLAARGLDVDGVSHVINFDLPHEPEVYVHRIGRTGRAGASGVAVSFCNSEERKLLLAIERLTRKKIRVEAALPAGMPPPDAAEARREPASDQGFVGRQRRDRPARSAGGSRGNSAPKRGPAYWNRPNSVLSARQPR